MYREEVPLYGTLVQIVRQTDASTLATQGNHADALPTRHQLERHGAVRLGTDLELRVVKRLFAVFGMFPVGYYDLGIVGFPVHATAFRPITEKSLEKNPFRVFTTVLRKALISPKVNTEAESILKRRNLFTDRLLQLIDQAEAGIALTDEDADDFVLDALKIFKWQSRSTAAIDEYLRLKEENPMIADIVCFPSAHINHLTPRTLDIDLVQKEMIKQGLPAKAKIEGPPKRHCPILLRQTSFKAVEEHVEFETLAGPPIRGGHAARFGEVEQRGAAVTREGRMLYDKLLNLASQQALHDTDHLRSIHDVLLNTFSSYPDTWSELWAQKLVYFRYRITSAGRQHEAEGLRNCQSRVSLEHLLSLGLIEFQPITYEDFLPFSAAGIFKSNLGDKTTVPILQKAGSGLIELESALECKILDEFDLYSKLQQESIEICAEALNLEEIVMQ